jgi:uncharacterized alpha-E superfamily protein
VLAALGYLPAEASSGKMPAARLEQELLGIVFDLEARGGLTWNLHNVRRLAWLLRDRISADAWRILNQLDLQFSGPPPAAPLQSSVALDRLNHAVITLSAFSGIAMESMTRGDGWRFLDIGRRIERGFQMTELLRHGLAPIQESDSAGMQLLLEIADSSITYRSRYLNSMQSDLVLDLLLVDEANPRSIAYQFNKIRGHIDKLPESQARIRRPPEARIALDLLTMVQLANVEDLSKIDEEKRRPALESLLTRISLELRGLTEQLARRYFTHAIASKRLVAP